MNAMQAITFYMIYDSPVLQTLQLLVATLYKAPSTERINRNVALNALTNVSILISSSVSGWLSTFFSNEEL